MAKRKVLIVIHQLNIGGVQKSLIPALDVIDYSKNDVTLYVRKDRTDLLPQVNKNVSKIMVNKDCTRYYRRPKSIYLLLKLKLAKFLHKDQNAIQKRLNEYIVQQRMRYEKKRYFSNDTVYDIAISYIQGYTAKFVCDNIKAKKKIMLYRTSTDEHHEMHMSIMKDFHRIYCVSNGSKNVLSELYPEYADKMGVIDTFIDANMVLKKSREYFINKAPLTLASCGRITSEKGFDLAVEAANQLKKDGINFIWYFVGGGAGKKKIHDIIELYGLTDEIVVTGLLDNPYPYIEACDMYVQPSYEESFGRTIKEAMILNKPVVSTKTVGAQEQIVDKENGILTDISAEGLAGGINTLLTNKELYAKIVENLRKKDYSNEVDEYRRKWEKLLEG